MNTNRAISIVKCFVAKVWSFEFEWIFSSKNTKNNNTASIFWLQWMKQTVILLNEYKVGQNHILFKYSNKYNIQCILTNSNKYGDICWYLSEIRFLCIRHEYSQDFCSYFDDLISTVWYPNDAEYELWINKWWKKG